MLTIGEVARRLQVPAEHIDDLFRRGAISTRGTQGTGAGRLIAEDLLPALREQLQRITRDDTWSFGVVRELPSRGRVR